MNPVEPRIEPETVPAERLAPTLLALPLVAKPPSAGGMAIAAGGAGVLVLSAAVLGTEHMIAAAFATSAWLGWPLLVAGLGGGGMIALGILRELRGLWSLRHVDHLRLAFASPDLATVRQAAIEWSAGLPEGPALLPALRTSDDPRILLALLRAGPAQTLRSRTDAMSATAGLQILAAIAAIPSPLLDGLVVAWRGIRLVRQVAELHGLRPGLFATLALLRRTIASAALVTATDVATNTAAQMLFSNRLVAHLAGDTATALVAARRLHLLARAAAAACMPLPDG